MPREQINYVDLDRTPTGEKVIQDDACLEVSWLAAHDIDLDQRGHVQVCVEVDVTYAAFCVEQANGSRPGRTQLFTPVLTRVDINKLIRTLKRARDAAYGTDE